MNKKTKIVMVTSPNNPTGTTVTHDEMVALMAATPPSTLVVLDEAYHEYITAPDAPGWSCRPTTRTWWCCARSRRPTAWLRCASATWWVMPTWWRPSTGCSIPFAVNGFAQAPRWRRWRPSTSSTRVLATLAERDRVVAEIARLGIASPDAQANFVWLPVGAPALALAGELEGRGVVTRPFAVEGVRVTIGTPAENDRFLAAIAETAGARPCKALAQVGESATSSGVRPASHPGGTQRPRRPSATGTAPARAAGARRPGSPGTRTSENPSRGAEERR